MPKITSALVKINGLKSSLKTKTEFIKIFKHNDKNFTVQQVPISFGPYKNKNTIAHEVNKIKELVFKDLEEVIFYIIKTAEDLSKKYGRRLIIDIVGSVIGKNTKIVAKNGDISKFISKIIKTLTLLFK